MIRFFSVLKEKINKVKYFFKCDSEIITCDIDHITSDTD